MKIADTDVLRPWGIAPNPTRDSSLDPLAGSARTRPRRMAGKGRSRLLRYSTVLLTTAPLRLCSTVFLHIQDGLLPEEDEHLPFAGHVVSALQHLHFVEDVVFIVFMRAQEVIVSDPERQIIVGAVDAVKAGCMAVRGFISPVQAFNHLLEWPVLGGNSIVVGKSNDLGDFKGKVSAQLFYELHCGEGIRTVSVRNEPEVLRQFCKIPERHAHGEDTGAYATVIRHLIADDGAGGGVHDEPDVGFDATDFDVCLVSREHVSFFVYILKTYKLLVNSCQSSCNNYGRYRNVEFAAHTIEAN